MSTTPMMTLRIGIVAWLLAAGLLFAALPRVATVETSGAVPTPTPAPIPTQLAD